MIIFVSVLYLIVSTCIARPSAEIDTRNVVTVPPNCPDGQEWVNGQCRDVWRFITAAPSNIVSVPTNCPVGQEWVNGQCRDVWRSVTPAPANVVTVPPNCAVGQAWVNGQCRDIWLRVGGGLNDLGESYQEFEVQPQNVITVPPNCPTGQEWVNGQCRDIWKLYTDAKNVITVPTNCPPGQQFVNGRCRDVWKRASSLEVFINNLRNTLSKGVDFPETPEAKNVISVPNQCPAGYKADSLGICRQILP